MINIPSKVEQKYFTSSPNLVRASQKGSQYLIRHNMFIEND